MIREKSELLIKKLEEQTAKINGAAFGLSGGVDSSLLFKMFLHKGVPYTTGVAGSQDFEFAAKLCMNLGETLHRIEVSKDDVIEFSKIVMKLDPSISFLDLGFETVLAILLGNIDEDSLVTGQGADEVFYGYNKFLVGREEDNKESLEKLYKVTLPRERTIAAYFNKKLITPYLDNGIPELFSFIPVKDQIIDGVNKKILRESAHLIGVPDFICERSKKAAQYGTGIKKIQERAFSNMR
jgi:asparagine synthase (glutamine-hydrolysing)